MKEMRPKAPSRRAPVQITETIRAVEVVAPDSARPLSGNDTVIIAYTHYNKFMLFPRDFVEYDGETLSAPELAGTFVARHLAAYQ